jgi:hypothetical protein
MVIGSSLICWLGGMVVVCAVVYIICVPNAPYSPRRGESAQQRALHRGGIGVLWIVLFM